jgi:transcriptional regulator with XRE-family HTH domain
MRVRLKELRDARNWTQQMAADHLGVSKAHISEMESGKKNPSGPLLDRMAKIFDISVPDLLIAEPGDPDDLGFLIAAFPTLDAEDKALILQLARRGVARRSS